MSIQYNNWWTEIATTLLLLAKTSGWFSLIMAREPLAVINQLLKTNLCLQQ